MSPKKEPKRQGKFPKKQKGGGPVGAKIISVDPGSPAAAAGVLAGEILKEIDGHPVKDVLDYRFYSAERRITLTLSGGEGVERTVTVKNPGYRPLGLNFETYLMDCQKGCHNKCVFCFIDQLPKGMRESLYFKDDDVRLSFLIGNYVTLTNLSQADFDRIKTMRLSPLHISVHATDSGVRQTLCHNKKAGECFARMHELAAAGIEMACQIVVCPGLNDGKVLEQTLGDLMLLYPHVSSVALVPVGLTGHREGLYPLSPVTRADAENILDLAEGFAKRNLRAYGQRVIYCSDELYLKAERPLPEDEAYEGYPQLENGVGMLRLLMDEFREALHREPWAETATESLSTAAKEPWAEKPGMTSAEAPIEPSEEPLTETPVKATKTVPTDPPEETPSKLPTETPRETPEALPREASEELQRKTSEALPRETSEALPRETSEEPLQEPLAEPPTKPLTEPRQETLTEPRQETLTESPKETLTESPKETPGSTESPSPFTIATGTAAAPFLQELLDDAKKICHNIDGQVVAVENRFFGGEINVAGLITGGDLISQLRDKPLGKRVLISKTMLRYDGAVFLDGVTPAEVEQALGVALCPVPCEGQALLDAMLNRT